MKLLKTGVLGVGHLGRIHLRCLDSIPSFQVTGFHDPDPEQCKAVESDFGLKSFASAAELIAKVDCLIIASPTNTHFDLAKLAISSDKHVFIEKPVTATPDEARELMELLKDHPVVVQVGHVERFNPAYTAMEDVMVNPMFIEGHRLATFNARGTDVSVVLDLMIHDLDIVLSLIKSPVKRVLASGVTVVSSTPDIANARIEFENGCVANLTASRMSFKKMRKLRLFQKDAYISMDFLEKSATIIRMYDENSGKRPENVPLLELETPAGKKWVHIGQIDPPGENAIQLELEAYANCIQKGTRPRVGLKEGYAALELAFKVIDEIENQNKG